MDRKTMRTLIIDYRNRGKTFREISEILRDNYGIIRDRQAIQGIYNRAIAKMAKNELVNNYTIVSDIVNLYVLGYNMAEITKLTKEIGEEVTYYKVRNTLTKELEYIDEVRKRKIIQAVECIQCGYNLENIKKRLEYKGVYPTDKGLKDILIEAYSIIVTNEAINELAKAYKYLKDKDVIKEIIIKTGLNVTLEDIKSRV